MSNVPPRPAPSIAGGLAHVAALSFLAARAAPPIGFPLALAGGVALARAGQRCGMRMAYGTSLAAMLELTALVGPARLGPSLTQALSAPLVGRLEGRGVRRHWQVAICLSIRFAYHLFAYAFFIWVVVGGLDAYAGTFDALLGGLPLVPAGPAGALVATAVGVLVGGALASVVQVRLYARGLRRWPPASAAPRIPPTQEKDAIVPRFDPRAVAAATLVAFALLLAGTRPVVLGAVAVWLAAAWASGRTDRSVIPGAVVLALVLALGAMAFGLLGGMGGAIALERALRAALLVAVAAWLRGAAGVSGLREVTRRALKRLRRLPAIPETAAVFDQLGSGAARASARTLARSVRAVRRRPLAVLDAVLAWVAGEAARYRPGAAPVRALRLRSRDAVLVATAACPALAFLVA